MAKKQQAKDVINALDKQIDKGIELTKPIDKIADLNLVLNQDEYPKTFDIPDQINTNFESNDSHLEILFSKQDCLEQISYYSEELLVALEGIFIGGHAAQIKDQLFEVLHKYKNGI